MDLLTCISCRVTFKDADLQRSHYKSDWHRYNLKRKVAELPPITFEEFQQKLLAQRALENSEGKGDSSYCRVCGKSFSSLNSYNNHLKSKKHKLESGKGKEDGNFNDKLPTSSRGASTTQKGSRRGQAGRVDNVHEPAVGSSSSDDELEDVELEEVDEDDEEEEEEEDEDESIPPTSCLFCPHMSRSLEDNLRHMTRSHSFFIPDIDFLVDIEGLILYLGAKVGDAKMCLYCNQRSRNFTSTEAVQMHMIDKGHCKLDYEGDQALEYSDFYDFAESYPDDLGSEDLGEELSENMYALSIDEETMELVLPSGGRAGHRAFRTYYKQSLPPEHLRRTKSTAKQIGTEYRALGWHGHGNMTVDVRRRMTVLKKVHQQRQKSDVKRQVKANKLQTHFRPQVIF